MKRHTENLLAHFHAAIVSRNGWSKALSFMMAWSMSYWEVSWNRKVYFPFHLAVLSHRLTHWINAALVEFRNLEEQKWRIQITVQSQLFRQHKLAPGSREFNYKQDRRNDCWQTWMHNSVWGSTTQNDDQKEWHVRRKMLLYTSWGQGHFSEETEEFNETLWDAYKELLWNFVWLCQHS